MSFILCYMLRLPQTPDMSIADTQGAADHRLRAASVDNFIKLDFKKIELNINHYSYKTSYKVEYYSINK